jgi:Tfp pilus assembly protein PilF
MRIVAKPRKAALPLACFALCLAATHPALAQQQQVLGSIIGHIHVMRGDAPPQPVLVTLEFRGAAMDSVYSDSQGTFGFHNLGPNPYTVSVNDDQYQPVQQSAIIAPSSLAPMVIVDITLVPKAPAKDSSQVPAKRPGANPGITDVREYSTRFPRPAMKEFEKGLKDDASGKKDDAIRHYQKAVDLAPDFYVAHNNMGSDYLSKSDFVSARRAFERVVQLNQSDAAAYFNLANVCMLMGEMPDAQRYLDEGMRREPDSALGHFLLGSLDIRTGKLEQAEAALRQAIRLSPVMAQARLQLINLLMKRGRNADAADQLHDFVKAFPDNRFTPQAKQLLQRLESSAHAQVHNQK